MLAFLSLLGLAAYAIGCNRQMTFNKYAESHMPRFISKAGVLLLMAAINILCCNLLFPPRLCPAAPSWVLTSVKQRPRKPYAFWTAGELDSYSLLILLSGIWAGSQVEKQRMQLGHNQHRQILSADTKQAGKQQ